MTDLPDRALSSSEAVRLWGTDRARLGECKRRHSGLASAVNALETQNQ